jgi:MFS family permease
MLMPFIKSELHLKNIQVGWLDSAYLAACAISTYAVSSWAESKKRRKSFLVTALVLFSVCSILPAFAASFGELLAFRLLTGFVIGPILPLSQSIIALESPVDRRGAYMGMVANLGGPILGLFVAPLALVKLASMYGWRVGFFVVAVPVVLCALLTARFVREPTALKLDGSIVKASSARGGPLKEVLQFRNVYLCAVLLCCYLVYVNVGFVFYPLFYIGVKQFSAQQMSYLMALLGISAALFGVLLPAISDRIGRRPLLVMASALGIGSPLLGLYFVGPIAPFAVFLFVFWVFSGSGSLFSSTIPSETVPVESMSTAMGLIFALGTLVGGLAGPAMAGWSADRWGLQAPLILQAGCAAIAVLASMALGETAPRKVKSSLVQLASIQ